MRQRSPPENASETQETEKALFFVVKRVREAILDEVFQPGDRLVEVDLAEKFEVSRQPVREALLALEKEGTVIMSPYKGAMVKPLSVGRSHGYRGTQVGPYLSGSQTGAPSPFPSRL